MLPWRALLDGAWCVQVCLNKSGCVLSLYDPHGTLVVGSVAAPHAPAAVPRTPAQLRAWIPRWQAHAVALLSDLGR